MRRLLVAIVVITATGLGLEAVPGAAFQVDPLVKLLTPPMTAVARLVIFERWDPRLNELIQRFPGAERLGSKWTSAAPAWQKARSGVGARLTALFDYYVSSEELLRLIRARLDQYFPGSDADSLLTVLKSPPGPSIVHSQARGTFVVEAEETRPDGPKVGSPEWVKETSALLRKFRERIPPEVPGEDKSQADAVDKFLDGPDGRKFSQLWMSVISRAETAVGGAMNLVLFDDRAAIEREIAQAIASVK